MEKRSRGKLIQHITAYTDGSCDREKHSGSSAFVIFNGKETKIMDMGCTYLPLASVYSAEVHGILSAIQWFRKSPYYLDKGKRINKLVIKCDNKSAVGVFNTLDARQKNGQNYEGLKSRYLWDQIIPIKDRVEVKWVKGHAGKMGNVLADYLAGNCRRNGELELER